MTRVMARVLAKVMANVTTTTGEIMQRQQAAIGQRVTVSLGSGVHEATIIGMGDTIAIVRFDGSRSEHRVKYDYLSLVEETVKEMTTNDYPAPEDKTPPPLLDQIAAILARHPNPQWLSLRVTVADTGGFSLEHTYRFDGARLKRDGIRQCW